MYWLDNNTGIPTAPTIPPVISDSKRYFTNGGAGVQPSVPEDFWFNMMTEELLGVLDMAGIAPDKDDLGQLAKAIQSIAFSAYPVGAPIPWPTDVPPSGFIAMTGQSFNATTYPKLALAYPALVLPDLRASFIRGWDNGLGVDPSRQLLSLQQATSISEYMGSFPPNGDGHGFEGLDNIVNYYSQFSRPKVTSTPYGVGVNFYAIRPRNRAFSYIVRAA